jgi:hypothetical protein
MKTQTNESNDHSKNTLSFRTLLLGVALLIVGSAVLAGTAVGSTNSFNNVQVFVTTSAQLPYSYMFSAYNLTGSLVASYQGSYPAAAFELPSGDYLFTVSATHSSYTPCGDVCAQPLTGVKTSSGTASAMPAIIYQQASEYGYQVAHIDSSTQLSIQTKNVTTFPTDNVTVKVSFVNGTAAAGAWVSASIVGQWYYWWGQNSGVVMSAQTGPDGVANLVLPVAPAVLTAWDWVPVNLPQNDTTVVVNVGGQKVNVTVYWEPTYVGLSASTLLVPPATSANLTLQYQQPNYWYLPQGVNYAPAPSGPGASAGQGGATIASQQSGVPSQVSQVSESSTQTGQSSYYLPTQIPALQQQGASPATSGPAAVGGSGWAILAAVVAVGAFAALGVAVVVLGRKHTPSGAPV